MRSMGQLAAAIRATEDAADDFVVVVLEPRAGNFDKATKALETALDTVTPALARVLADLDRAAARSKTEATRRHHERMSTVAEEYAQRRLRAVSRLVTAARLAAPRKKNKKTN